MTTTAITLTRDNDSVTFTRRGDRATMKNSRGEAIIMGEAEALASIHRLIDAGWRMA